MHLQKVEIFNELLKKVLIQRPENTKEFNEGLKEVVGFLDFMRIELPILYQKWEEIKK